MNKDDKTPKKEEVVEAIDLEQLAEDAEITDEAAEAIAKRNAALMDAEGVPKYDEADEEIRARMDAYIEQIDINDYDSIINFAAGVFDQIEEISDEVNQLAQDENLFKTSMQDVYAAGQEGDVNDIITTLRNMAANTGKAAGDTAKSAVSTVAKHPKTALATLAGLLTFGLAGAAAGAAIGAGSEMVGGKPKKKGEQPESVIPQEVRELLATANSRLASAHVKMKSLGEQQPKWKELLREQAKRQLETYMELSIVCGAGYEKVKRIRENELAVANDELTQKPGDKTRLQKVADISRFASELEDHVNDLMMTRTSFYEGVVGLREQLQTYERQHRKMMIHTKQGLQQQKAAVARIAHVLKNGETADVIAFLDKFTQDSARLSSDASELLTQFTISSSKQGVNNSKLLVQQVKRTARGQYLIAKSIVDNAQQSGKDLAEALDAQRELSEAVAHRQGVEAKLYLAKGSNDGSGLKQLADESKKKLDEADKNSKKPFGKAATPVKPTAAPASGTTSPAKKPGGPTGTK